MSLLIFISNFATMDYGKVYNIIVAAGNGSRFGANLPKQYCLLENRPVLMHTIENMRNALPGSEIILVISKSHEELWNNLCDEHRFESPAVVYGGETRWQSVKNAIEVIPDGIGIITVHDGARPFVDERLMGNVLGGVAGCSGAIPVIPVTDSLRLISVGGKSIPVDRSVYRAVQTPQAFRSDRLVEAYRLPYQEHFTDDASVMKAAGYDDIILVEGNPRNIKITLPDDIGIASVYMRKK